MHIAVLFEKSLIQMNYFKTSMNLIVSFILILSAMWKMLCIDFIICNLITIDGNSY